MEQLPHQDGNSLEISDLLGDLDCTLVLGTHRAGRASFLSVNREGLFELPGQGGHRGRLELVDMGSGKGGWWGVSPSLSCLGLIDDQHGFRPRWHPPFISKLVPEDRCHLSGMAMGDDQPLYASALGDTNTAQGWRPKMLSGGILMHVPGHEIILRNLPMPHSPRLLDDRLYFLNAATGELITSDPATFTCETIIHLPGFARGLACFGDYLFIGVSPVPQEYRFSGMAISPRGAFAGIAVVHLPTGTLAGGIQYLTEHEEIYGIQVFPGQLRPDRLDRLVGSYRRALSILDNAHRNSFHHSRWGRSVNQPLRSWILRIQRLIEMQGSRMEGSRKDHRFGRRRLPQRLTQGMATAALTGALIVGTGIGPVQAITPFTPKTGLRNPFANGDPFYGQEVGNVRSIFVDIDGDGDLDAFSRGGDSTPPRFFENVGSKTSPSFVERTGAANPLNSGVGYYITPTFVDIDGDGDFDVFFTGGESTRFFENQGSKTSPSFVERTGAANPLNSVGGYIVDPTFVDIDGDGDFDLFSGGGESTPPRFFKNEGSKTSSSFVERTGAANPLNSVGGSYLAPIFVDIDGDGDFDAFFRGGGSASPRFFKNEGSKTSPSFVERTGAANPLKSGGEHYTPPIFVDIDGDGDFDAFFSGGEYTPHRFFKNEGSKTSPNFVERTGIDVGATSTPAFVDIDGDGDFDAFVGASDGEIHYFQNTGTKTSPVLVERTGAANPFGGAGVGYHSTPTFVDIDGDGDFDAFVGASDGEIHYFQNTGTKTSPVLVERTGAANPFDGAEVGYNSTPAFVDIDGDGDFDAFVGAGYGEIHYFQNTGTKTRPVFVERTGADNPFDGKGVGSSSAPAFLDIDGDGDFDAFVGAYGGEIHYFQNTGTKTRPVFVERTGAANPFGGAEVGSYSAPAFVDIDGDGDFDAFVGKGEGTVSHFDTSHDPFLCYKAKATKGTPKFVPILGVNLTDQFETGKKFDVTSPLSLCTPADKNDEGINDPDTHLKGYVIKAAKGSPKQVGHSAKVVNQFGELSVDTVKPDRLLVPTAKSLTGPVAAPDPAAHHVDHYKCYTVKVTKGTPPFPKGKQATVGDHQFTDPAKLLDIPKPSRLCLPADKDGSGFKDPAALLMCYQGKPAKGQPKHIPRKGIHVNNQFGPEQLDTVTEEELCVPSARTDATPSAVTSTNPANQ